MERVPYILRILKNILNLFLDSSYIHIMCQGHIHPYLSWILYIKNFNHVSCLYRKYFLPFWYGI